ncbi:50S ribosomal protein L30 [Ignicoccus hospitalis]|uniref:Large ribosomal subunit protein uL30 n=1 Tax=Ignicoccus hospitalis (strain KIN4/I / DSM 18386 / JCM 14125) TaxID=453591 RepID=RL30_IGNH4|nr:50S ribosomal protein L30 [Ignicoccus hospitalis]A8ABZ9.1 RecName: Full=Large ribosomal subunit protein uL30; AltName: Full=50S ribosomal protein L30 [Ignicoccus hospitalis KIN4/I]ABU82451.1 LSU ribosomal protein L30P [Ignicoccus hospitalis KIN4/I]HIH90546.1 50S ribosomal protein L30 [Desulfurococcaceae archaeon]
MSKKLYLIIRIKGEPDAHPDVRKTLENLRLLRRYAAVVYPADLPGLEGMLRKAQAWITWGEIRKDVLAKLLEVRGRAPGDKKLTPEYIKEKFGVNSFEELAEKIINGEVVLHKQEAIKPFFRLHPPRGGFKKSIKKPYRSGGEAGYRGEAINELVLRML